MSERLSMSYPEISDSLDILWIYSNKTLALTRYLIVDLSSQWLIFEYFNIASEHMAHLNTVLLGAVYAKCLLHINKIIDFLVSAM